MRTSNLLIANRLMDIDPNDWLGVVAFNTVEHWAKDVSEDIAAELQTLLDMEGNEIARTLRDFVESHRHSTRQPSLRLAGLRLA